MGISALVLLALIQALCMFCRCNGGRDGDDNGSSGSFADRLRTGEDGYLDEKVSAVLLLVAINTVNRRRREEGISGDNLATEEEEEDS